MRTHKEILTVSSTGSMVSYSYLNNEIRFLVNKHVMINATTMAKPFGTNKYPAQWFRTSNYKEFIAALAEVHLCTSADLVKVIKGGNDKCNQGTWMHEDVALEFARWLSPAFAIWCNDRIKELLKGEIEKRLSAANVLPPVPKKEEIEKYKNSQLSKPDKEIACLVQRISQKYNMSAMASCIEDAIIAYNDLIALGNGNYDKQKYNNTVTALREAWLLFAGAAFEKKYRK